MEGDGLGLDLALLHVDLVTGEDDRDVLADTDEVTWKKAVLGVVSIFIHGRRVTHGASWGRSCK